MQIAIVLCVVIGAVVASPLLQVQSYGHAVNTGRSQVMRKDDGHGNYEFGYDEDHHSGGTSRREKGGKGWQQGSYEIRDKDGRKRTVNYVADAHGFRAKIDSNEPGVDGKQDPADVSLNAHGTIAYAQPIAYIAKAEPTIAYASAPIVSYSGHGGYGNNGGYNGNGGYGNNGGYDDNNGYGSYGGPVVTKSWGYGYNTGSHY